MFRKKEWLDWGVTPAGGRQGSSLQGTCPEKDAIRGSPLLSPDRRAGGHRGRRTGQPGDPGAGAGPSEAPHPAHDLGMACLLLAFPMLGAAPGHWPWGKQVVPGTIWTND